MSSRTQLPAISPEWTLFLDRDGVINIETPGTYVTDWRDFRFTDGALEALRTLGNLFGKVVVVTNQRGVGRGIMSLESLREINTEMSAAIHAAGGKLDRIYACTAVSNDDNNRKPNVGMALQAREDYREIDFRKSVIVGNSLSDMEFGKRLAMHTVFITSVHAPFTLPHDLIDEQFPSLAAWAMAVGQEAVAG